MEKRLHIRPTGPQLRAARAWIGWSLSEAAKETGVHRMTIHKIESEQSDAQYSTIIKLVTAYSKHGIWMDRETGRDMMMFETPEPDDD